MSEINEDHRTRVGAERRERMRRRLIENAMLVFAEKGVNASVIEDVISTAQVSRGTFYYYFRTNQELQKAVSEELMNELLTLIEGVVGLYEDPAKRIACGLRLYFHTAMRYPLFAKFVSKTGFEVDGPDNRFYEFLPVHIQEAVDAGRFKPTPLKAALDLLSGTSLIALHRASVSNISADYVDQIVSIILRGLGMKDSESAKLISLPLSPLHPPAESLLERSKARFTELN